MRKSWMLLQRTLASKLERVAPLRSEPLVDRPMDVPMMNTNLSQITGHRRGVRVMHVGGLWRSMNSHTCVTRV